MDPVGNPVEPVGTLAITFWCAVVSSYLSVAVCFGILRYHFQHHELACFDLSDAGGGLGFSKLLAGWTVTIRCLKALNQ